MTALLKNNLLATVFTEFALKEVKYYKETIWDIICIKLTYTLLHGCLTQFIFEI